MTREKKHLTLEYQRYIQSAEWKAIRKLKLQVSGHKCSKCSATKKLHVHHLTYKRFKHELLSDLQVLCRSCHIEVHSFSKQLPPPELRSVTYTRRKKDKKQQLSQPKKRQQTVVKPTSKKRGLIAENERLRLHKQKIREEIQRREDLKTWSSINS